MSAQTPPQPQPSVSLCCPVQPHHLPRAMERGLQDIVRRVAAASAAAGSGRDLLLRIYLAGVYHGVRLGSSVSPSPSPPASRETDP